ncbi:MAG TPA: tRNA lysidine(34) synthetase TilS [Candidatus Saccharimonadales bacterium]|nr:tRNA lysidine(34) synthetase TilS [Candidatus Saccharimonadales bacterium]
MITHQLISNLIPHNATIIVGFSGGPDSVCLLIFLNNLKTSHNLTLIAAHLDHEWRPESSQDALWCMQFCKKLNITFVSKKLSELDFVAKSNGSKEEMARKARRHFFEQCAQQFQASHIALAHHQDDQIETFFIRLTRGSSVAGLGCMRTHDGLYIRPLLSIKKQEILDYLAENAISFLIDSTNDDLCFLRNRIRKNLTPILHSIDPRLQNNIISCIDRMQKTDDFLEQLTQETVQQLKTDHGINQHVFLKLPEVLQQRILITLLIEHKIPCNPSTALFQEIIRFLRSNKHQQHQIHPKCTIIKQKNCFSFKPL